MSQDFHILNLQTLEHVRLGQVLGGGDVMLEIGTRTGFADKGASLIPIERFLIYSLGQPVVLIRDTELEQLWDVFPEREFREIAWDSKTLLEKMAKKPRYKEELAERKDDIAGVIRQLSTGA